MTTERDTLKYVEDSWARITNPAKSINDMRGRALQEYEDLKTAYRRGRVGENDFRREKQFILWSALVSIRRKAEEIVREVENLDKEIHSARSLRAKRTMPKGGEGIVHVDRFP